jgi:hypothetical protein
VGNKRRAFGAEGAGGADGFLLMITLICCKYGVPALFDAPPAPTPALTSTQGLLYQGS